MNMNIRNGNAADELKKVPDETVDCMITDPPYGISFMNRDWDRAVPDIAIWRECLRVMKPGAFAFVMCSPRSDVQAEMILKLREAGFDVGYPPIYWAFSQGFPKAMNISKAVDRKIHDLAMKALYRFVYDEVFRSLGIPQGLYARLVDHRDIALGEVGFGRVVTGMDQRFGRADSGIYRINQTGENKQTWEKKEIPATEEAKRLDGSFAGFQPKPAVEVILVVMKPLSEQTYVDQALKNGKGVTWLDDGRIPYQSDKDRDSAIFGTQTDIRGNNYNTNRPSEGNIFNRNVLSSETGRFPANLLVSDDVLNDGSVHRSGIIAPTNNITHPVTQEIYGKYSRLSASEQVSYGDEGSLSRFFSLDAWYTKNVEELPDYVQRIFPFLYVPKAAKSEREQGLTGFQQKTVSDGRQKSIDNPFQRGETLRKNVHPTVKPVMLMTYLVSIGSRPGDTILDPFMGSGTTGVAAKILNRDFIGCEINGEYFEIAEERIEAQPAPPPIRKANQSTIESHFGVEVTLEGFK